jgi:arylsulfatase A
MKAYRSLLYLWVVTLALLSPAWAGDSPNIVYVLCDDLGYGDIQYLNPDRGMIPTPAVDQFAREGMVFTDAHSGSSVCTPTRYGLLTGRYSWRTRLQSGVVQGFAPNLIAADRLTVASLLRENGYHTAIIGKWHLNFKFMEPGSGEYLQRKGRHTLAPVGSRIPDGPIHRGFNYFHGFHHARVMKCVIENDTVIAHEAEIHMLPRLIRKSVEYIEERAGSAAGRPFFLYVPLGSPHSPIVPTEAWRGKSGLGDYADFVMQTDAGFGTILDALDRNGFASNTLVIFTSDNGASAKWSRATELEAKGHYSSARYRGYKSDVWEGGHRVPFIVRWPSVVEAGSESDQTICLTDLMATVADILDAPFPVTEGGDSVSFLPALQGKPIGLSRSGIVHHSISGHFSYRQNNWKLVLAKGSGGWTSPREADLAERVVPIAQLYDLANDPEETVNLYESRPELASQLLKALESDVARGRSTAGPEVSNDVDEIVLWKSGKE